MDISQVITQAYQKLNKVKINSASLDAEILLSFVIGKPREYMLAHPEFKLRKNQILKFNKLIVARAKNIPLAYLTQVKEFYGRNFYVDRRVLVPRPETEMIIEECRMQNEECRMQNTECKNNTYVVDVGTGSGCIIITLTKELKYKNLKFLATDISKDALTVARKNAKLHGVDKKIKFLQGNLLEPILKNKKFVIRHSSFVICANLPYLTPAQIKNSPTIKHEPKLALSAGKDGLKYYRELAKQLSCFCHCEESARFALTKARRATKQSRPKITLLCEIDPKQNKTIKTIFSFAKNITIKKDLAGRDRLAVIKF
ncbi:MAG: peptide chain release factor N(5)-glutamine methyltransferase [Patescibacteria group bacterium]